MRVSIRRAVIALLGVVCALTGLPAAPAHAVGLYRVVNGNDFGQGSLRVAIDWANNNPGLDMIVFALPGTGPWPIVPLRDLPPITDPVIIDGYSEPDSAPATDTAPARPTVVLDGYFLTDGLILDTDASLVAGLVINNVRNSGGQCRGAGICVKGDHRHNVIRGNVIGLGSQGEQPLANLGDGVRIEGSDNTVGGPAPADRNVISGNSGDGVDISSGTGNIVRGNRIGTSADGTTAVANQGNGVTVWDQNNRIGGSAAGAGNLVSGNKLNGIELQARATGTVIEGNVVGTNAAGTEKVANVGVGVWVHSDDNLVGGYLPGTANVVAGNGGNGVQVDRVATGNSIAGNLIGVTPVPAALGNDGFGVLVSTNSVNTLGGDGGGNTIAFNGDDQVRVSGDNQQIVANVIGYTPADLTLTRTTGTADGIEVSADATLIEGNTIGRNRGDGIRLNGGSDDTTVGGNAIGVDQAGTTTLSNRGWGLEILGDRNRIGSADGTVAANLVVGNGGGGINVAGVAGVPGLDNAILGNRVYGNTGMNLDLAPAGVTADDYQDVDPGPNNTQNFPFIDRAAYIGAGTVVKWEFNSTPLTGFRVEFFAGTGCGNRDAQTYLGSYTIVATDNNGDYGPIETTVAGTLPGTGVVATATELSPTGEYLSTSEISPCRVVS